MGRAARCRTPDSPYCLPEHSEAEHSHSAKRVREAGSSSREISRAIGSLSLRDRPRAAPKKLNEEKEHMKMTIILRVLLLVGVAVLFFLPISPRSNARADTGWCVDSCASLGLDCFDGYQACLDSCSPLGYGQGKCMGCCVPQIGG